MKTERIESSETSALKAQTPGDYPKNIIRHSKPCLSDKTMGLTVVNVRGGVYTLRFDLSRESTRKNAAGVCGVRACE